MQCSCYISLEVGNEKGGTIIDSFYSVSNAAFEVSVQKKYHDWNVGIKERCHAQKLLFLTLNGSSELVFFSYNDSSYTIIWDSAGLSSSAKTLGKYLWFPIFLVHFGGVMLYHKAQCLHKESGCKFAPSCCNSFPPYRPKTSRTEERRVVWPPENMKRGIGCDKLGESTWPSSG